MTVTVPAPAAASIDASVEALTHDTTTVEVRPRYEGNNICTWIGFKHVNYLVEEAVLAHFRAAGLPSRHLYEEYGLGLDLVALDTRILNAFHLDDVAVATVVPTGVDERRRLTFAVKMVRDGATGTDVTSAVAVALRRDTYVGPRVDLPTGLAALAVDRIARSEPGPRVPQPVAGEKSDGRGVTGRDPVLERLTADRNAFGWKWRIPYPYCHNNERLQMSGYLRQMEEVVDLFLADRGISIKTLLDDRRWIPVVPHSRIEFLDEALMEEDLYTVYTVEEVFKGFTYRSRMDTYVVRDGHLVQTATGTITHGYAVIENRKDWRLLPFDARVLAALQGGLRA